MLLTSYQNFIAMPVTTNFGTISTTSPPVGDFNVTTIDKGVVQVDGQNFNFTLSWTPPAGGADRYEIEWFNMNDELLNPDNKISTGSSIALTIPKESKYRLIITSYRGATTSYVIIEDIVKLDDAP